MKNILKIAFLSLTILLFFSSCDDEVDRVIYDGLAASDRTLITFPQSSVMLPVPETESRSIDVAINASTISSSDRTYNIVLNADETTVNVDAYTLPTSVTIPADSYEGILTVSGTDVSGLLSSDIEKIVFSIGGLSDTTDIDNDTIEILIFSYCEVPSTFMVGDYVLEDGGGWFGSSELVTLSVDFSDGIGISRDFEATLYPTYSFAATVNIKVTLVCGKFLTNQFKHPTTLISCDGETQIVFASAEGNDRSNYSLADDSFLAINYVSDVDGSCGGPFLDTLYLTKQ